MTAFIGTIVIAGAAPQPCTLVGELVNPPDNSLPQPPVVVVPPIYYPPYPDNSLPRPGGRPDNTLPGQLPDGIWGGRPPSYPDNTLPGEQPSVGGGPILPPPEKPSGTDQWQWHLTRYGWGLFPPQADKPQPAPQPPQPQPPQPEPHGRRS